MNKLTKDQKDLLDLLEEDENLQFYTFKRLKGLEYFDELQERGFLDPKNNPPPIPADKEGLYRVPTWDILEYLLKTSPELSQPKNEKYIYKFLKFIEHVTKETEPENTNYKTWWYFAQILSNIPPSYIEKSFIKKVCAKWFEDHFNTNLIIKEFGKELLPQLINSKKLDVASELLRLIVQVEEVETNRNRSESIDFKGDNFRIKSVLDENKKIIAQLGRLGLNVIQNQLIVILDKSDIDKTSPIWRPAIEDHDQNRVGENKAKNILINSYRDILSIIIEDKIEDDIQSHVKELFNSSYITLKRIAIYQLNYNWNYLKELSSSLIDINYFTFHYRHELFGFLNKHFDDLTTENQQNVLNIIDRIEIYSDEEFKNEQIASNKLVWLTAIKDSPNQKAQKLYAKYLKITGKEPTHPDFSFYMETGYVANKTPINAREIVMKDSKEIVNYLNKFEEDKRKLNAANKRGLAAEFLKAIKLKPVQFINELDSYINLKDIYLSQFIKAFINFWEEEKSYDLEKTLNFISEIIEKRNDLFGYTHSITLKKICEYIIRGTKKDSNAFNEKHLPLISDLLESLLTNLKSKEFDKSKSFDELNRAINTNKGKALEALINFSLRKCRLADKNKGDHKETWEDLQTFYNKELKKAGENNFEFHAIITKYMPNLLYLNEDWVYKNINKIFTKKYKPNWLAAINGFTYSNYTNGVFEQLVKHGHFSKALTEDDVKFESKKRLIEYAGLNYFISDQSKATKILINRWNEEELSHLAWAIWTMRDKFEEDQIHRIMKLWEELYKRLDKEPLEKLLSNLNYWAAYLNNLNSKSVKYLLQSAPYACVDYNSYILIEELDRLVEDNPESVGKIYLEMLEKECIPYHDKRQIKHIVEVLINSGFEEIAEEINKQYLANKMDFIATHLTSIS